MNNVIWEDDLNTALFDLQSEIGQDYGDNAGMFFSKYDDAEDYWEKAPYEEREQNRPKRVAPDTS